jgi:outer membrane protein assembly factor BamB
MPSTRRGAIQLLGTAAVAGLAGCGALDTPPDPNERPPSSLGVSPQRATDGWLYPAGDAGHTAHVVGSPPTAPEVDWHRAAATDGDRLHGGLAAVVDDRILTVADDDGATEFQAFAVNDGGRLWRRRLTRADESYARQPAGVVDDKLFLTDYSGELSAVSTADGTVAWRRNLFGQVAGAVPSAFLPQSERADRFGVVATATPDGVYVASAYGLHGVTLDDGTEEWRLFSGEPPDRDDTYPTLGRPVGVAPTPEGAFVTDRWRGLVEIDSYETTDSGFETAVSQTELPVETPGVPVVTGDQAVVGSAVVWSTGPVRPVVTGDSGGRYPWQFAGVAGDGDSAHAAPVTDGDRVYVCEAHETPGRVAVTALRADSGGLDWQRNYTPDDTVASLGTEPLFRVAHPVVAGDTLLIGYGSDPERDAGQGVLLGLDADDGTVQWQRSVPVGPQRVAVVDDRVFVVGFRGGVVALCG